MVGGNFQIPPKGGTNVLNMETGQLQRLLTDEQNPDASIAELQELYANLQDHAERLTGNANTSPSRVPTGASPRGPNARSDDNSVGESLEETADDKKKKLLKKQVAELESMFQNGYTGLPDGRGAIAKQMGISERQVAIWFQNRRARQRSKELSQDFEMLKKDFRMVFLENQILRKELTELRAHVNPSAERDTSSVRPPADFSTVPGDPGYHLNPSNQTARVHQRNPQTAVDLGYLSSHGRGPSEQLLQHTESLPLPKRPRLCFSDADLIPGRNANEGHFRSSGFGTASFSGRPPGEVLESLVAISNAQATAGRAQLGSMLQSGEHEWRPDDVASSRGIAREGQNDGFDLEQLDLIARLRAQQLRNEAYRSFLEASGNADLFPGDSQNDNQRSRSGFDK